MNLKVYPKSKDIGHFERVPEIETTRAIYFLIRKDIVVYVGKSATLLSRIRAHRLNKKFDHVRFVVCPDGVSLERAESAFIRYFQPKYNSSNFGQAGGFDLPILRAFGIKRFAKWQIEQEAAYAARGWGLEPSPNLVRNFDITREIGVPKGINAPRSRGVDE